MHVVHSHRHARDVGIFFQGLVDVAILRERAAFHVDDAELRACGPRSQTVRRYCRRSPRGGALAPRPPADPWRRSASMTSSCACSPPVKVTGSVASTSRSRPASCRIRARCVLRYDRGCAESLGPARASPAARPGRVDILNRHVARDPLVAQRHDVNRHSQIAIGSRRPGRAPPDPSTGRRRRQTQRTAGSRQTGPGAAPAPAPAAFHRPVQGDPFLVPRWQPAPARIRTSGLPAGDPPVPELLSAADDFVGSLDRLVGYSRLMLRDSSSR